jgi:predicted Zn-dependent protease
MITLEGRYYDGHQPQAIRAKMDFGGPDLILTTEQFSENYANLQLKVSPRIGSTDRFVTLPNGGQFQCADNSVLESLPQESRSEGVIEWLEERWGAALAGVFILISMLLVGYFFGLPKAANLILGSISIENEQKLGEQALNWLDSNKWFNPTKIDRNKQMEIRDAFEKLVNDLPNRNYYHLNFRDASFMGPNAFALPGAEIVIPDGMVNEAQTQEEVLAVLAHETGHVELRHTMRSVLQNSIIGILATAVSSDATSLSFVVAGLPALVAQNQYSREFETEADEYAFGLLKKNGYSPLAFASLMERLEQKNKNEVKPLTFLSSHPLTSDRIKRARTVAGQ